MNNNVWVTLVWNIFIFLFVSENQWRTRQRLKSYLWWTKTDDGDAKLVLYFRVFINTQVFSRVIYMKKRRNDFGILNAAVKWWKFLTRRTSYSVWKSRYQHPLKILRWPSFVRWFYPIIENLQLFLMAFSCLRDSCPTLLLVIFEILLDFNN